MRGRKEFQVETVLLVLQKFFRDGVSDERDGFAGKAEFCAVLFGKEGGREWGGKVPFDAIA